MKDPPQKEVVNPEAPEAQKDAADFTLTHDVGLAFLQAYPAIIRKRMHEAWTKAEREHQLIRLGCHVEVKWL
jgi:coproporphyrinogen III oxidase